VTVGFGNLACQYINLFGNLFGEQTNVIAARQQAVEQCARFQRKFAM
jgi:hypothetical protein